MPLIGSSWGLDRPSQGHSPRVAGRIAGLSLCHADQGPILSLQTHAHGVPGAAVCCAGPLVCALPARQGRLWAVLLWMGLLTWCPRRIAKKISIYGTVKYVRSRPDSTEYRYAVRPAVLLAWIGYSSQVSSRVRSNSFPRWAATSEPNLVSARCLSARPSPVNVITP